MPTGTALSLDRFALNEGEAMGEVLKLIDKNGEGVAVIVDEQQRFTGIVTDGDVRRAIMSGLDFHMAARDFLKNKQGPGPDQPLTALATESQETLVSIMEQFGVRHIPLVDDEGKLAGLALLSELAPSIESSMHAVVMAGGKGMRLRPLTNKVPKPLLPIGGKPVIERIVDQLRDSGVHNISISTHYHAEKIQEHFGDGSRHGVNLRYTEETEPLGTAGALSLLEEVREPVLVINGDILTAMDFRAMLQFHKEHKSDLTVAVRKYDFSVPFGVVDVDGARVKSLKEKPNLSFFINAGVYLMEPEILERISPNEHLDMTDLIDDLLETGGAVTSFPIHEYWIDIGQLDDYTRAQTDVVEGKLNR